MTTNKNLKHCNGDRNPFKKTELMSVTGTDVKL